MKNVWPESFQLALGPAGPLTAGGAARGRRSLMEHLSLSPCTLVRPLTKGCFTLMMSVNVHRTAAQRGPGIN